MCWRWFWRRWCRCRDEANNPVRKLVVMYLQGAIDSGADMICLGVPQEDPQPVPAGRSWELRDDPRLREAMEKERPGYIAAYEREMDLMERSGHLRHRNGHDGMVVRQRIDGVFYDLMDMPLIVYPDFLRELRDQLVALDGSEEHPQPTRYIELFSEGPGRRFAEVETFIEPDNTIRIHILGVCEKPASVVASSDFAGRSPRPPRGRR